MRSAWFRVWVGICLAGLWACDDGGGGTAKDSATPGADVGADVGRGDGSPAHDDGVADARTDGRVADRGVPGEDAEGPDGAPPRDARVPVDSALTDGGEPVPDGSLPRDAGVVVDAAVDAEIDQGPVSPCPGGRQPVPEDCDGVDDDCDGAIDEDLGLADACEGVGRCGVGFVECDEAGGTRCSTDPEGSTSQAGIERCNGEDDDCDGLTDESPNDFAVSCYEGIMGTEGVGLCRAGTRRCVAGRLGDCIDQRVPSAEQCNGGDDDCNGRADDGLAAGEQVCGVGACRLAAQPGGCINGVQQDCRPGPPTGDDSDCDGQDDDCDGRVDEGYQPLQGCGVGVCAERARPGRCEAGVEVPCLPALPAADDLSCDGRDDDCDGRTDENYQTVLCGTGVCRDQSTPSACINGIERLCAPGPVAGNDADCDGRDQDCDGRSDESYRPVVQCGVGVCAVNPSPSRCDFGRETACLPGLPSGGDLDCNGMDEDCDARTDEGYVIQRDCGQGVCADTAIPSSCTNGVVTACQPGQPAAAVDNDCDGRDSDCDGVVDDEVVRLINGEQALTQHGLGALQSAVARSGNTYGVVWSDNRNASSDLYYSQLDAQGRRVGGEVLLQLIGGAKQRVTIASDGAGGFGLVWQNTRTGRAQLHFARIAADGAIIVADTRLVDTQANAYNARLVFNGAEFGLTWADQRSGTDQVWFTRLSTLGEILGMPQQISPGTEPATVPSLADRGPNGGWAVAYNIDQQADFDVVIQPIAADGTVLGARRQVSAGAANSLAPTIAPTAAGWGVAWYDTRDDNTEIYMAVTGQDGVRLGAEVRVTNDQRPSFLPSLTATPGGFGVAFTDRRAGNDEIWFQHLDAAGVPFGPPERISNGPGNSFGPALINNAGIFALTWYDARSGFNEIYFALGPIGCGPMNVQ